MRSGTIKLSFGRWHWTLLRQWTGTTVVFQHGDRVHDEMRTWTAEVVLTEAQARELGRDPLERVWADVDGLKWRLSIELPAGWRSALTAHVRDTEDGMMWLVFRRGGFGRAAEVDESARLGDYTHSELRELLEKATRLSLHS